MKHHELAELFPMMGATDLKKLSEDIKENGQQDDIVVLDDAILDGRNRHEACKLAGINPRTRAFGSRKEDGTDPLRFVISLNLKRRHLTDSQRAMVAAQIAKREKGRAAEVKPEKNGELSLDAKPLPPTQKEAAAMMNVKPSAVKSAAKVLKKATPEVKEAVKAGKVSINKAKKTIPSTKPKKEKPAKLKPVDKMLAALDAWWLEKGEEMKKHPIASPEAMWKHFTKLVVKTLS